MSYETIGGKLNKELLRSQISQKLRELQTLFSMLGHIYADEDKVVSHGLLGCSELAKKLQHQVIQWSTKGGKLN